MNKREQFEAAIKALAEQPNESYETPYADDDANAYWAIWQASRRAALEESAKVCDRFQSENYILGASECAAAIRALSHAKGE